MRKCSHYNYTYSICVEVLAHIPANAFKQVVTKVILNDAFTKIDHQNRRLKKCSFYLCCKVSHGQNMSGE